MRATAFLYILSEFKIKMSYKNAIQSQKLNICDYLLSLKKTKELYWYDN